MKILGIDYGKARIGLAISNEGSSIAFPFVLIKAFHDVHKTIDAVAAAISKEKIHKIVIGLPLLMSGKESPMSLEVRAFGEKLKEKTATEVIYWDERLTSKQVEKELIEQEFKRKKRTELVDLRAATLILQSYLDSKNST